MQYLPRLPPSLRAHRYVNDAFVPTHQPTVGVDFFIKEITLDNGRNGPSSASSVRVQLWDIAGQDRAKKVNRVSERVDYNTVNISGSILQCHRCLINNEV